MKAVDKKSTRRTRKNKKYVLGQKDVGQLSYIRAREPEAARREEEPRGWRGWEQARREEEARWQRGEAGRESGHFASDDDIAEQGRPHAFSDGELNWW